VTEAEWLASDDPAAMLRAVGEADGDHPDRTFYGQAPRRVSDRKLRLWVEACREATRRPPGSRDWRAWEDVSAPRVLVEYWSGDDAPLPAATRAALLRCVAGNPWRPVTLPTSPVTCPSRCSVLPNPPVGLGGLSLRWQQGGGWNPCQTCKGKGQVAGPCLWLTPDVLALAAHAYGERDWSALLPLADALEEAGCDSEDLLRHLRGHERCGACLASPRPGKVKVVRFRHEPVFRKSGLPGPKVTPHKLPYDVWLGCEPCGGIGWRPLSGPHARGCWALDLLLGKE
jgi:hypothetical protein